MDFKAKFLKTSMLASLCLVSVQAVSLQAQNFGQGSPAMLNNQNVYNQYLQPVVTAIDYHTRMVYLFNYEEDKVITLDPRNLQGWPGDIPLQHTLILPGADKLYITSDNTDDHPAYIIALNVYGIDWDNNTVSLSVESVLQTEAPGTPAELPYVEQTNPKQPIPTWVTARATQIHGPTLLPFTDYAYFTKWTSDEVRVIDLKTSDFANVDPIIIPGYTEQTHGINFNKSGTIGLGTGYFFDNNVIDVYTVNRQTGALNPVKQVMLGDEKRYAAFTHFVYWLDERYALTASMQLDKTSLTPPSTNNIIPPSVWLIDAVDGTATQILNRTNTVNGPGVFRSASDLAVVGGKLYIAEEDSLDNTFARDGYISIFDLSDRTKPKFIKRLRPGHELPEGFAVAHTLSPTPDNRYLLLASWVSGYVIKIDTLTDTVAKVFGPSDGLVMPHGIYAAGGNR
ncbi:YncE family protein [Nitrosomonas sp. ANs5]|uniref:YncE family protein n=1 Tax=Nitrosomonas sp. ANs5 TaxID=3423941 RepID=UPI003D34C89B